MMLIKQHLKSVCLSWMQTTFCHCDISLTKHCPSRHQWWARLFRCNGRQRDLYFLSNFLDVSRSDGMMGYSIISVGAMTPTRCWEGRQLLNMLVIQKLAGLLHRNGVSRTPAKRGPSCRGVERRGVGDAAT